MGCAGQPGGCVNVSRILAFHLAGLDEAASLQSRYEQTPRDANRALQDFLTSGEAYLLLWDEAFGAPPKIDGILGSPGDAWHGGLSLGLQGHPRWLDFVVPTWMLHADADPSIASTSWRLSFRCCLLPRSVVQAIPPPHTAYTSLAAAGLDYGHRLYAAGVLVRFDPRLSGDRGRRDTIPDADEARFVANRYGRRWAVWALFRSMMTRRTSPLAVPGLFRTTRTTENRAANRRRSHGRDREEVERARVSILIPTLERADYLATLLGQLREQTVPPIAIVVVDQSSDPGPVAGVVARFGDLPLTVVTDSDVGQSTARNVGLEQVVSDLTLFLDDDVEVSESFVESHLETLSLHGATACSGPLKEPGSPDLGNQRGFGCSDVFPTSNSVVRTEAVRRVGGFDVAFDGGQNEDHDLGMRLYLAGELMIFDPALRIVHHRAPRGGLREHGMRKVTFASSRSNVFHRRLPAWTELYLYRRYYSEDQVREMKLLLLLGSLMMRGPLWKRLGKAAYGLLALPHTILAIRGASSRAAAQSERTRPN